MRVQLAQQEQRSVDAKEEPFAEGHPKRHRLGTFTYLPARALVYGLESCPKIELVCVVPSQLKRMLAGGEVHVALRPAMDLPCFGPRLTVLPAGCLAASGPTLLAKVFSQVKPEDIRNLGRQFLACGGNARPGGVVEPVPPTA